VAALAVLALAASGTAARADQTLNFNIIGAGSVTGSGLSCVREAPGAAQTGTCSAQAFDGAPNCDELFCIPNPGTLAFQANDRNGYQFDQWSHPQCTPVFQGPPPFRQNPCTVSVALGANPDLTVNVTFKDVTAPGTTLTAPANGAAVRGTIPLTATATDNSGTVASVQFRVGGNPFGLPFETAPFTTNLDTTQRADGSLAISATATDGSGLAGAANATVTVDNHPPTLNVTGPNNQTFGPGATPTWTLAAADQTTAVNVRCSVVPVGQPANLGNCTGGNTQQRLVNPADGRYTLTVRATDAAGNFVEQARAFAVDTGPPDTTITSGPGDGSSTEATSLTWGLGASEASTFECRLYLTATGPGAFAPCSGAASHTVSGLAAGSYTFEARAIDGFNNVDPTPVKRTVLVVSPPPVIPPPVVHQTTIFQQVIVVTLTFSFHDANKKTTRISALTVNSVPTGATVSASCPKGCAKKSLVIKNAKGNVSLKALAGKKPLKVKTKITVTVSKPGAVGAVKVLEVQKRKAPTVQSLCLPPGAAKPGRCA